MIALDDDQDLVNASVAGDRDAYGVLVRRYEDRLYPTLLRLSGSPEDALDLRQDAFVRAYEKLDQFHGHSSFYTWLYRISVNLALSKRRKPEPRCVPFPDPQRVQLASDRADSDPVLRAEQGEAGDLIQLALNELPDDYRAVVVLKEFDGLRYEEIAELLEIPIGTVRSRLHRARAELRARLQPVLEPEAEARGSAGRHSVG
jgi:RNA polymerase sigma-70 factor (ECF subfamily)